MTDLFERFKKGKKFRQSLPDKSVGGPILTVSRDPVPGPGELMVWCSWTDEDGPYEKEFSAGDLIED